MPDGRFVALVLALSLIGSLPLMSEPMSLLASLTLLDSRLLALSQKLEDSALISAELAQRLSATRAELEVLRNSLTSLSGSLTDSEKRAAALETTVSQLERSLATSGELSREQALDLSRWRSRARRRLWVAVGLAALAGFEGWLLAR